MIGITTFGSLKSWFLSFVFIPQKNDSERLPVENFKETRVPTINLHERFFHDSRCVYTPPPESPDMTCVLLMMSLITALSNICASIQACQRFSECTVFTSSYISTFRVIIMNHDIFPVKVSFGLHPKDVKVLKEFLDGSDFPEKVCVQSLMNLK